jgi:hypothetical protein
MNSIDYFVGFLQQVGNQADQGLLPVPGTASFRVPELSHHLHQAVQGIQDWLRMGNSHSWIGNRVALTIALLS